MANPACVGSIAKDFKAFLLRGNVVDLAVAVVIGAAFGAVVASLVSDLITPVIAAVVGKPDFSGLVFTINDAKFRYGAFLNALIAFVTVSAAVFFLVVTPVNALLARTRPDATTEVEEELRECPECLSDVPARARRCRACTAEIGAAS